MSAAIPYRPRRDESGLLSIDCPRCGSALDLSLPDHTAPDRLLGICFGCRVWYLIDERQHLIATLPDRLTPDAG